MALIWIALSALVIFAGIRYRQRLHAHREPGSPAIDDAAIQRIIDEGNLPNPEAERRSERQAAADAEEEFWDEYWDEPEEYEP